jgi:hypothetical protein
MTRRLLPVVASLLLLTAAACEGCNPPGTGGPDSGVGNGDGGAVVGDGGPAPTIPGAVALAIAPVSVVLSTDGVNRPTQEYVVTASMDDGSARDVSNEVSFTLSEPNLGQMNGATFESSGAGGTTDLIARAGPLSATAQIRVELVADIIDDTAGDLPPNPTGTLDGAPADPDRAPELLYPNDGVLVPKNLGVLEVHFYPGTDNELFAVTYESPAMTLRVFTRCDTHNGGCIYTPSELVWQLLRESNAGRAEPITVRVQGTDDDGTGAGEAATTRGFVSAGDVEGGLYYWTTTAKAIMRVDFGAREQVPERFFPEDSDGPCYGCHALSPDGTKMSLSQGGQWNGQMTILDVGSLDRLLSASDGQREQFQAWDPTSSMFAAIYGDDDTPDTNIRIREGETGNVLEEISIGTEVSHPHWSADGERIAFTVVTHHYSSQRPGRGGISYVEREGMSWSSPQELIAPEDGMNRYTPVYSPDSSYMVYVESECPQGETYDSSCDADADDVARLWAMSTDGSGRVQLAGANGAGALDPSEDLANTFPRWAPFEDPRFSDGSGRIHWMTFSSRRHYGLRDPDGKQLLWMVAVDPDVTTQGQDGSYPAFALPFQDLTTSNHIAQWTEVVVPTGGDDDGGTPGGSPDGGIGPQPDGGVGPQPDAGPGGCVAIGQPCGGGAGTCCPGTVCLASGGEQICQTIGG